MTGGAALAGDTVDVDAAGMTVPVVAGDGWSATPIKGTLAAIEKMVALIKERIEAIEPAFY